MYSYSSSFFLYLVLSNDAETKVGMCLLFFSWFTTLAHETDGVYRNIFSLKGDCVGLNLFLPRVLFTMNYHGIYNGTII